MPEDVKALKRRYPMVPDNLIEGLIRFRDQRIPTGSFLRAVLENDLFEAVRHADSQSMACLRDLCRLVYNDMPSGAIGSAENVARYLKAAEVQRTGVGDDGGS